MREYQVSYGKYVSKRELPALLKELGYNGGGNGEGIILESVTTWYLKTSLGSDVTRETEPTEWRDYFTPPDLSKRFVWRYMDYWYTTNHHTPDFHVYTDCEIVTMYSSGGGTGIEFAYALFNKSITEVTIIDGTGSLPITNPEAQWSVNLDQLSYNSLKYLWMSQRVIDGETTGSWQKPIRISGKDGDAGADGLDIEFIYKSMGRKPDQSLDSAPVTQIPLINRNKDDYVPEYDNWSDSPHGVDDDGLHNFEWMSFRSILEEGDAEYGTYKWSEFSFPIIWSAYGEKGMDGDGVEYVYKHVMDTTTLEAPSSPKFSISGSDEEISWNGGVELVGDPNISNNWKPKDYTQGVFVSWIGGKYGIQGEWIPNGWTDDPSGVGYFGRVNEYGNPVLDDENNQIQDLYKYEYVSSRKKINGVWGEFSNPKIWSTFSKEHTLWIDPETGLWWIDGQETNIKAEGENGKGIDLKGKVDYYDSYHRDQLINSGFEEDPNHVYTFLSDVENTYHPEIGDCYVVMLNGHIYLYVGGDDEDWKKHWSDFGEFQGEGSYVHIAWAHYYGPDENNLPSVRGFVIDRATNPSIEYEWMGICTNHEENDPGEERFTEYKWNYVHGRDGDTFERVYVRTTQKTVPPTIGKNQSNNYDPDYLGHTYQGSEEYIPWVGNYSECGSENHGSQSIPQYRFTDDPLGPNLNYPYEWMAERKKVDGIWQTFNTPSIHSNYSHDGQSIVRSTVFKRSITAPIAPYGGSFLNPYPTDTTWKDGLPTGEGPIWMSSKIFTNDEQDPQDGLTWPTPTLLKDSEELDIEFSNQPKTGTPTPPIDYDNPGGNRHNPEEPSGYDHSATGGKKQLWFDPEQDATYISAHATEFNWMATRTSFYNASNDSMEWRDWVILLIKGEAGEAGDTFEHAYLVFPDGEDIFDYWPSTAPTTAANTPPNSITVTNSQGTTTYSWVFNTTAGITVGPEQALWMTERKVSSSVPGPWSDPIKISGNGTPGEDAEDIEFIYKRSNNLPDPEDDRPSYGPNSNVQDSNHHYFEDDDFVPGNVENATGTNIGWYDNPSGVDSEHKYEWMCQRVKPRGVDQVWQDWSNVFVWSAYGDTGMDGDGIEYVYTRVSNPTKPNRPKIQRTSSDSTYINWDGGVENTGSSQNPVWEPKDYTGNFYGWIGGEYNSQGEWVPNGWTDDPKGVDEDNKKEYVSQRKRVSGVWGDFSDPAVWSTYSHTPVITIGPDGCWWVDGETTGKKAEGPQGQGIQLKDTVDVYSINDKNGDNTLTALEDITPSSVSDLTAGDCYVVKASRYLYVSVYDGETWDSSDWTKNWDSIGEFQGQPGEDGVSSYMHIAWALAENVIFDQSGEHITDITEFETWAEHLDPELDYEWMGICTDDNIDDSDDWQDYKWNHVKGKDGDNYERVYVKTKVEIAPGLNQNSYDDPNGDKTQDEFLPLVLNYDSSIQGNDNPYSNYRFTDDPSGVTAVYPYEWVAERKKKKDPSDNNIVKWFDFSPPALWAKYSFNGNPGVGIQTRYTVALIKTGLTISNPSGETPRSTYTDSNNQSHTITWQEGTAGLIVGSTNEGVYYLWMTQRSGYTGNWENWTTPIRISGEDGKPGVDGPGIEFIFKRQGTEPDPPGTTDYNNKTYQDDDYVPQYWEDSPVGVDNTLDTKYEWACQRVKLDGVWQAWSPVFLWSAYGETGMDGDGVEYVYFRRADAPATPIGPRAREKSNNSEKLSWYGGIEDLGNTQTHNWSPKNWDVTTNGAWSTWEWDPDAGYYNSQGEWIPKAYNINGTIITNGSGGHIYWSDDPSGVTKNDGERLEWVSVRRRVNGVWDDFTSPKLWASFGSHVTIVNGYWVIDGIQYGKAEGEDGKGVSLKGSVDVILNKDKNSTYTTSLQEINPVLYPALYGDIQPGDCYVVRYPDLSNLDTPGHLFVALWDKDSWKTASQSNDNWDYSVNWDDIGEFQGAPGENSYMHIAWAESKNIVWDSQVPNKIQNITEIIKAYEDKTEGITYDWMGICTNHDEDDPSIWSEYKWNHVKGKDGVDFERVYSRSNSFSVVPVVNQNTYEAGTPGKDRTLSEFYPQISNYTANGPIEYGIFTDDPKGSTQDWPYEWYTERRKEFDDSTLSMVWRDFGPVKLWTNYSYDGLSANLTKPSDNIVVDSLGTIVGGLGSSPNYRLYTEVKIWDPNKDNGTGGYLAYQSTSGDVQPGKYKLSISNKTPSHITTSIVSSSSNSGRINITDIGTAAQIINTNQYSFTITATVFGGKTFSFVYTITVTHLEQTYFTYSLSNDYDSITYRTKTKQYDGLPVETIIRAQINGKTIGNASEISLSRGYMKSVTVTSSSFYITGTEGTETFTKTVNSNIVDNAFDSYGSEENIIIKNSSGTDTGLRLNIFSNGTVRLSRRSSGTDVDLPDAKHYLDISCVVVYMGVEYPSIVKRFTISEITDSTLYDLILSKTDVIERLGVYSPSNITAKVKVTDENGENTYTPNSSSGRVGTVGSIYVKFFKNNAANLPTTYSSTNTNFFYPCNNITSSLIQNNTITAVVIDTQSSVYHDIQEITISHEVPESSVDITPSQFIVDCNSSGKVSSTRYLDFTAWLKWGGVTCTKSQLVAESCSISQTMGGTYTSPSSLTIANDGTVSGRYTFTATQPLTSGEITITLTGSIGGDTTVAYGTISVIAQKQGQPGDFKSTAFIKTYTDIKDWRPTGGSYSSPKPTGFSGHSMPTGAQWEDGIPAGEETLWSSTATFYGSGATHTWSFPKIVRDSETYDVEFAFKQSNGNVPSLPVKYDEATTTNKCNAHRPTSPNTSICTTQIWYDPEEDSGTIQSNYDKFYWKAEREIINGATKPWVITQIKGESEPNIRCDTPIIVIETDPTGKLNSSSATAAAITIKTWLRLGETVQSSPTWSSCTYSLSSSSSISVNKNSGVGSDYSISWTITPIADVVLSNTRLTIDMTNGSCSATKSIDIVFERKNRSKFKSTVFTRTNTDLTPYLPTGGSYTSPTPSGMKNASTGTAVMLDGVSWSDGIPSGNSTLWASSRTFSSDGQDQDQNWSPPRKMTDTQYYDVEFSDTRINPGNPTTNPSKWFDPGTLRYGDYDTSGNSYEGDWSDVYWRAEKECRNGIWDTNWTVLRIKGETGDTGTGISSVTPWYKAFDTLDVVIPSAGNETDGWAEDGDLTGAGWTNSYVKPTKENPYLWKFIRTIYENPPSVVHNGLEMIQVWSENMINPNLLDDTDFLDNNHLGGWSRSIPAGTVYYRNTTIQNASDIKGGTTSYYSGRAYKQYYVKHKLTSSVSNLSSSYIVFLAQTLYDTATNGIRKIDTDTWYTLSFYCYARYEADSVEQQAGEVLCPANLYIDLSKPALGGDGNIIWTSILGNNSPVTLTNTSTAQTFVLDSTQGERWTKIIVTFKTKSSFSSASGIEFKLLPLTVNKYQCVYITEPKLEIGKVATDYISGDAIKDPYPRLTVWGTGKQYYRGNYGEPYLDAVTYGANWFRCRNTHISSDSNKPVVGQTTAYWEPAQNLDFIVTDLLLAETGYIKNLIVGGLRTGDQFEPHVEMSGSDVNFYGSLGFPNIRMKVDNDGMAYLKFYDKNNQMLYDLGPSGINWLKTETIAEHWSPVSGNGQKYYDLGDNYSFGNVSSNSTFRVYQYFSQIINGVVQSPSLNTRYFQTRSATTGNYVNKNWSVADDNQTIFQLSIEKFGGTPEGAREALAELDSSFTSSELDEFSYEIDPESAIYELKYPIKYRLFTRFSSGIKSEGYVYYQRKYNSSTGWTDVVVLKFS